MKVAIVTDTHFGARSDSKIFSDHFSRFWQELFFPTLDERCIKHVIHCGDIMDRRKFVNYVTADTFYRDFLNPISERDIETHMIIGNHDTYYKNTNSVNSMRTLLENYEDTFEVKNKNIKIYYEKPEMINIDNRDILLIPWICPENKEESFRIIRESKADVAFGHLEIVGFQMYRGSYSTEGYSRDVFDKYSFVASGHFHHKSSENNIHYLGSTYEMTWADHDDRRGFHIFDTDTMELEYIENPFKMFYRIFYDDARNSEYSFYENVDYSVFKDTFVKVVIINKENPYMFEMFMKSIYSGQPFDVKLIDESTEMVELSEDEHMVDAQDTLSIMSNFIENSPNKGEKEEIMNFVKNLYHEAIQV